LKQQKLYTKRTAAHDKTKPMTAAQVQTCLEKALDNRLGSTPAIMGTTMSMDGSGGDGDH
jgi:hypothetical protein